MKGDPYLHDVFCSVLEYDVNNVLNTMRKYYNWKLIRDYSIYRVRRELPLYSDLPKIVSSNNVISVDFPDPSSYVDVVWVLRKNNRPTHKHVVFNEVKTGRYDIDKIIRKYSNIVYSSVYTPPVRYIFIWSWSSNHVNALNELRKSPKVMDKVSRLNRQGIVRFIPLELIVNLAKQRISRALSILRSANCTLSEHDFMVTRYAYKFLGYGGDNGGE